MNHLIVRWQFLFSTLFQQSFVHWVRVLYTSHTSPLATATVDGLNITILHFAQRHSKDALSLCHYLPYPLKHLQQLSVKTLASLESQSIHHKISLYADDLLIYPQNPSSSLPTTINLINTTTISDNTNNCTKSTIPLAPNRIE